MKIDFLILHDFVCMDVDFAIHTAIIELLDTRQNTPLQTRNIHRITQSHFDKPKYAAITYSHTSILNGLKKPNAFGLTR